MCCVLRFSLCNTYMFGCESALISKVYFRKTYQRIMMVQNFRDPILWLLNYSISDFSESIYLCLVAFRNPRLNKKPKRYQIGMKQNCFKADFNRLYPLQFQAFRLHHFMCFLIPFYQPIRQTSTLEKKIFKIYFYAVFKTHKFWRKTRNPIIREINQSLHEFCVADFFYSMLLITADLK